MTIVCRFQVIGTLESAHVDRRRQLERTLLNDCARAWCLAHVWMLEEKIGRLLLWLLSSHLHCDDKHPFHHQLEQAYEAMNCCSLSFSIFFSSRSVRSFVLRSWKYVQTLAHAYWQGEGASERQRERTNVYIFAHVLLPLALGQWPCGSTHFQAFSSLNWMKKPRERNVWVIVLRVCRIFSPWLSGIDK